MTGLFDKNDVLTGLTADKAVIGTKGFFGDSLYALTRAINTNNIDTLVDVDTPKTSYRFGCKNGLHYILFLPINKVKNKEPSYRPLRTFNELFNFLVPDFDDDTCNTDRKAEILLGKKYQVKDKTSGAVYFVAVGEIYFKDDILCLDGKPLNYFFERFEIKKDGEFVPFGILEE